MNEIMVANNLTNVSVSVKKMFSSWRYFNYVYENSMLISYNATKSDMYRINMNLIFSIKPLSLRKMKPVVIGEK